MEEKLKLIIADDERVIRETIRDLIDWDKLGIELIGLCQDGIEAYNMILDESPDLVITDIRMPGLTGLELVREISRTDEQIQFLILSGYEDFDYAREAMKYGVRYYLLKPCSEEKLEESLREAAQDCRRVQAQARERLHQSALLRVIRQDALYHMMIEGLAQEAAKSGSFGPRLRELMEFYGQYQDFDRGECCLYYVYYLEKRFLEVFLTKLEALEEHGETQIFYGVYVHNTLLLFGYTQGESKRLAACIPAEAREAEIREQSYAGVTELLESVLKRVARYDTVYAIHGYRPIAVANQQSAIAYLQGVYPRLASGNREETRKALEELRAAALGATQTEVLRMMADGFGTRLAGLGGIPSYDMERFLQDIHCEEDQEALRKAVMMLIESAGERLCGERRMFGALASGVMDYVEEHLSESNLTLKKIAEETLFMNVDYVSRQFRKDTGKKFSQYLTERRIGRAKELLREGDAGKIAAVAEQVGCGNNPQYFSQIFKKAEGMTPAKWAARMRGL